MPGPAVVIPTLDEEDALGATLAQLLASPPCPLEVVVVDGGSRDRTREVARAHGVRVLEEATPGRARQMNAGARATTGDPILFLHADTRVDACHLKAMLAALADPSVSHGSFPIELDAPGAALRFIAAAANLRTRLDRTPYGDQALFVRRQVFLGAGGFPEVPIGEDVLLAKRLRRRGGRYVFLAAGPRVRTSARRWQRDGVIRRFARNLVTRTLLELGVAPERLVAYYDASARPADADGDVAGEAGGVGGAAKARGEAGERWDGSGSRG